MSTLQKIVKVSTGVGVLRFSGMGLMFLAQLFLARMLGVTGFGELAFALACTTVLSIPASVGMQTAGSRFVAEYLSRGANNLVRRFAGFQAVITLCGGGVAAAVLIIATALFGDGLSVTGRQTLYVGAFIVPLLALAHGLQGTLRGFQKQTVAEATDQFLRPIAVLAVASALVFGYGHITPVWAMMAFAMAVIITVSVQGTLVRRALPAAGDDGERERANDARAWLRAGSMMMLLASMQIVMNRLDILMLGTFIGPDEAGIYTAASQLALLGSMALAVSNTVVAPIISEFHVSDRRAELQYTLTRLTRLVAISSILVLAWGWIFGEWVLGWFGDAFDIGFAPLMILLLGQFVNALCGPVGYFVSMTGYERWATGVQVFALTLNVVLNLTLIPAYGMVGAAIATASSMAFWNLVLLTLIVRRLHVDPSVFGLAVARTPA